MFFFVFANQRSVVIFLPLKNYPGVSGARGPWGPNPSTGGLGGSGGGNGAGRLSGGLYGGGGTHMLKYYMHEHHQYELR